MTDPQDEPIRTFLAAEAERRAVNAPTLDEAAARMAIGLGARPTSGSIRQMVILVAATLLLVATLGFATAIGSGVLRIPFIENLDSRPVISPAGYEAVFLRGAVRGGEPGVTAIGIDAEGRERVIGDVAGGVEFDVDGPYVLGAVSRDGMLALATGTSTDVHWELHDLRVPGSEPVRVPGITQDVEQLQAAPYFSSQMQPSVFWGPGDVVAIPWYVRVPNPTSPASSSLDWRVTFAGETGNAWAVDVPDDLWTVLPQWAADGSGVLLGSPIGAPVTSYAVLRPDGSITDIEGVAGTVPACRSTSGSGRTASVSVDPRIGPVEYACFSPDDERIAFGIGVGAGDGEVTATRSLSGLAVPGGNDWTRVEGKFAGWMDEVP